VRYGFIREHQEEFRIRSMCRVLKVSRSGYYAWLGRSMSLRQEHNRQLLAQIQEIHQASREAYGSVKVWKELRKQAVLCGKNRVARLRRVHGIETKRRKRFKLTTQSKPGRRIVPDLVNRCFRAQEPNRIWVGDVTAVATREGWLYLAVLVDLYSRRVVGWSMSDRINKELVLGALKMALVGRNPQFGLIHHTDRGAIYAADEYRKLMAVHGIVPSMGRTGDCYDNAVAESFFATVENELILGQVYPSRSRARTALFEYIEVFYNRQRIHQTLGHRTPQHYEDQNLSLN
jgi:transposase InsO family protein